LESYRGVGYVVRVWNANDTAQTHIVKNKKSTLSWKSTILHIKTHDEKVQVYMQ